MAYSDLAPQRGRPGATTRPPWDRAADAVVELDKTDALIVECYGKGMKTRAIAEKVGLSPGTIGTRLFRLRQEGVIGRRNRAVKGKPVSAPLQLPSVQIRDDVAKMNAAAARAQERRETLSRDYATEIALYNAGCGYLRQESLLGIDANMITYRLRVLKAAQLIPHELPPFDAEAVARILGLPQKVKATAPAADFVCISPNAWPNGPREMACLTCTRPFLSEAKDNRRCTYCRGLDAGPDMAPALALHSTSRGRP